MIPYMKKQPDAETMLRIAKSIKGAKVEVVKGKGFFLFLSPFFTLKKKKYIE